MDRIVRIAPGDPLWTYAPERAELSSGAWAGLWNEELAVMWGVIPASALSDQAMVWSKAWPKVLQGCRKTFLRRTREVLEIMHQQYPVLTGVCYRETAWLDHLGAKFEGSLFELRARNG